MLFLITEKNYDNESFLKQLLALLALLAHLIYPRFTSVLLAIPSTRGDIPNPVLLLIFW